MKINRFSEWDDLQLIEAINDGDSRAYEELYRRYREWVVGLAYRLTGDHEIALEVLQEAFMYLLGKFPGFELTAQMKTFLYPVVRNLSISIQSRARRIQPVAEIQERVFESEDDAGEDARQLSEHVSKLPIGQREVLLLRFVDRLSLEHISAALGIPVGTVKSRLHHALEVLRDVIGD